ncbi:MAG: deoxyguanosinetriphosphate triphosphohydrolase [Candidatus Omnitrophica bacterium]|nr:deoxyguanosinetriphosphate triphosphohydrolase [Candidatus Omnitrophota bacterium]
MITREEIEDREITFLAPYAVKSKFTKGRAHSEDEHPYRSVFQRDKDRILFSASFRRLQYKAQVFSNFEGDYYRTRLTHTLEVSHIARSIARSLRLNEDLSEAIALAHDLGHGPFGHIGEKIINECMEAHGGFEHNRQSLRVVEKLEDIYSPGKGLNLTAETKQGLQKHTYRDSDSKVPISHATLEAQLVDIADEIAYDSHDIDDGVRAGLFHEEDLHSLTVWKEIVGRIEDKSYLVNSYQRMRLFTRFLINDQVTDLLDESERRLKRSAIRVLSDITTGKEPIISFSQSMIDKKKELKAFLYKNFYRNTQVMNIVDLAESCIKKLFKYYCKTPETMPVYFYQKVKESKDLHRIVCDYIAGMTDRYAYEKHKNLPI